MHYVPYIRSFFRGRLRSLNGFARWSSTAGHATGGHATGGHARSITEEEFLDALQACRPLDKWPNKLAVAFSGGPDSTCLLYLLSRIVSNAHHNEGLPNHLLAVTIDHGIQDNSAQTAQHCAEFARSLQVPHTNLAIPWSTPPFPALPPKRAFENTARNARYHLLFSAMLKEDAAAVAFGHHADDQVETALLRLARGSSEVGAGGMRTCRRWGMGFGDGPGDVGWAGYPGMSRWIVRPLLGFSKDRILATCKEHGLQYVEDPTNFQPEITPRNGIRQALERASAPTEKLSQYSALAHAERPLGIASKTFDAEKFLISLMGNDDLPFIEILRETVGNLSKRVEEVDQEVTSQLKRCILPSPLSTIVLSRDRLSDITDTSIRLAIVLRILRYVSPYPWGSTSAEAGRRSSSLRQIVDRLWERGWRPGSFVSGGDVLWAPITVQHSQHLSSIKQRAPRPGDKTGWLASRLPPSNSPQRPEVLHLDITQALESALKTGTLVELLYDCRFWLQIDPRLLPLDVTSTFGRRFTFTTIHVEPDIRYYLPKIVWRRKPQSDVCLASILPSGSLQIGRLEGITPVNPNFIRMQWIRSLDSDGPARHPPLTVLPSRDQSLRPGKHP